MRTLPLAALALLAGCQAYMPSSAPPAPGAETVRIPFVQPRAVILSRGEGEGGRVDTIADATAVYGRVIALRGDTLRMTVTQVARRGRLQYVPSGADATIAMSSVAGVERWSHSPRRTAVLLGVVGTAALAVGLFFMALAEALGES